MTHTRLRMKDTEMRDRLLPFFAGRVFHVSQLSNLPAILAAGAIVPNTDGSLRTTFGYTRSSYFRKRGCVSVFDLRTPPPDDSYLGRCSPWSSARHDTGLAIFFLSPSACTDLLPWTGWKDERALGETVAPYVEAGHKGPISLTLVDELLEVEVEVDENPNSLVAKLDEGRRRAARGEAPKTTEAETRERARALRQAFGKQAHDGG